MKKYQKEKISVKNHIKVDAQSEEIRVGGVEGLKLRAGLPMYKKRRAPSVQKPRIRLNQAQKARLELSYQRNADWSNSEIEELAALVGVPFTKVYKWSWERKKKDQRHVSLQELAQLYPEVCDQQVEDTSEDLNNHHRQ